MLEAGCPSIQEANEMTIHQLKNYQKPKGYKYYNYFVTNKGDYVIYSRDGKRFYLDNARNSKLVFLPNNPFKSATLAKKYLKKRVKSKSNFP